MKHRRIDHVLRNDGILREIVEGKTRGKSANGRTKIQMQRELVNNEGYVAHKR